MILSCDIFRGIHLVKERHQQHFGKTLTLPTLTLVFIFMINIPFVSLYQLLSSGTLTNNPVTLGIISIAPSLLLSSPLVWILKNKVFSAFVDVEMESEEERGEDGERVRGGLGRLSILLLKENSKPNYSETGSGAAPRTV